MLDTKVDPPTHKEARPPKQCVPRRSLGTCDFLGLMEVRRQFRLGRGVDDPVRLDNWQGKGTLYDTGHR